MRYRRNNLGWEMEHLHGWSFAGGISGVNLALASSLLAQL